MGVAPGAATQRTLLIWVRPLDQMGKDSRRSREILESFLRRIALQNLHAGPSVATLSLGSCSPVTLIQLLEHSGRSSPWTQKILTFGLRLTQALYGFSLNIAFPDPRPAWAKSYMFLSAGTSFRSPCIYNYLWFGVSAFSSVRSTGQEL